MLHTMVGSEAPSLALTDLVLDPLDLLCPTSGEVL